MFKPTNEQGVIVLFVEQAEQAGIEIVEIHTQYPDAIIKKDGKIYKAEFEYLSSNFLAHKHDPTISDLIICYEHDWLDCPLPVIELKNSAWAQTNLSKDIHRLAGWWRTRALKAEKNLLIITDRIKKMKGAPNLTQNEQKAHILHIMSEMPGTTMTQLTQDVGISRSTLYRRLDELKAKGKIKVNGAGYTINQ